MKKYTRRNFLRNSSGAIVGSCMASSLFPSCKSVQYIDAPMVKKQLRVSTSVFIESQFAVLRNDALTAPVYVAKIDEKYHACFMSCTHNQCELRPTGMFMTCPCHGSEFSNTGKVLSPPASQDLTRFKTHVNNETVFIELT